MNKFVSVLLFLICVATVVDARADGFGAPGITQTTLRAPPVIPPVTDPPVNVNLPEIVGLDTVGSTLSMRTSTSDWTNSPSSFTCIWHMIGGSSLGTNCASFGPLTSAMVTACSGSTDPACGRLEVDVVAHNAAGNSTTAISDFVGPVETALPLLPFMIRGTGLASSTVTINGVSATVTSQNATNIQGLIPATAPFPVTANTHVSAGTITTVGYGAMNAPTSLPVFPAHYLQNGHAIPPGCKIPPVSQNVTAGHVWYFDPINGTTQAAGATGSSSLPFKDIAAINHTTTGYTSSPLFGFGRTIPPGDTIYVRHGDSTHPLGNLDLSSVHSTSDGTIDGTVQFTWIMPDPTDPITPILLQMHDSSISGFVITGFKIENNALDFGTFANLALNMVNVSGTGHDNVYENLKISSYKGHSADPFVPSAYPTTGGLSDGTIQTASPYMGTTANTQTESATAPIHATRITMNAGLPSAGNIYVWSPDYFTQNGDKSNASTPPNNTGIPNGTKVLAIGTNYVDIGPCDPVADHATGCPSTNTPNGTPFVGCDPLLLGASGGCNGGGAPGFGAAPVWNGTTRALSNDLIIFTPNMVVTPNGYWNHLNWDYANDGITVSGGQGANNLDSVNPNDVIGNTCVSFKNNLIRYVNNGFIMFQMSNVMDYNNKVIYRGGDARRYQSSHRMTVARAFSSDSSFQRTHPDMMQWAQSFGTELSAFYGNSVTDMEGYSFVDPNNQFPDFTESIIATDSLYPGMYLANNIIMNSSNALSVGGVFGVSVHNFSNTDNSFHASHGIKVIAGFKAKQTDPAFSLMADNLTSNLTRATMGTYQINGTGFGASQGSGSVVIGGITAPNILSWTATQITLTVPSGAANPTTANTAVNPNGGGSIVPASTASIGTPCTADRNTVSGNLQLPSITYATGGTFTAGSIQCGSPYLGATVFTGGKQYVGVFSDENVWTPDDYRTEVVGVTSPFTEFHPLPEAGPGLVIPANPSPCLRNEVSTGTCAASGAIGTLNLRPNGSFTGTPVPTLVGATTAITGLAQTGTIGDKWMLVNPYLCANGVSICGGSGGPFVGQTFPAGIYTRCNNGTTFVAPCTAATPSTTMAGYGAVGSPFNPNNGHFNPTQVATGVALGINGPPANHGRQPWTNPPNIGPY